MAMISLRIGLAGRAGPAGRAGLNPPDPPGLPGPRGLESNMLVVRLFRWLVGAGALVVLALAVRPYAHGLSFVIRAAEIGGTAERLARFDAVAIATRDVTIPTRAGAMRGRVYEPDRSRYRRVALLTSGLHPS